MAAQTTDWYAWHAPYDELTSPQTDRLAAVQDQIARFLDSAPTDRPVRVISLAAGQSRDLLPLLIRHPRGGDVRARVVELDDRNVDFAEGAALGAGIDVIEFVSGDAGLVDTFAGAVPADLVLACGLFDLLTDDEVATTIAALPQLCAGGATVIWTDRPLTPAELSQRQSAFAAAGFDAGTSISTGDYCVAAQLLRADPQKLVPGTRMFQLS
jgi:hypothetical protein